MVSVEQMQVMLKMKMKLLGVCDSRGGTGLRKVSANERHGHGQKVRVNQGQKEATKTQSHPLNGQANV